MDVKAYWDGTDFLNQPTEVSWYEPHVDASLKFVAHADVAKNAAIIDVGCGTSALFDYLLELGYTDLTCMDISGDAFEPIKQRIGKRAAELC